MLGLLLLLKILFASQVKLCHPQSHFVTFVSWLPSHQKDHHQIHLRRPPQMHLCLHFCCCILRYLPKFIIISLIILSFYFVTSLCYMNRLSKANVFFNGYLLCWIMLYIIGLFIICFVLKYARLFI